VSSKQERIDGIIGILKLTGEKYISDATAQKMYNFVMSLGSKFMSISHDKDTRCYWEDHWQSSFEAMLIAAKKWDPSKKANLLCYMYKGIELYLLAEFRDNLQVKSYNFNIDGDYTMEVLHILNIPYDIADGTYNVVLNSNSKKLLDRLLALTGHTARIEDNRIKVTIYNETISIKSKATCLASYIDDFSIERLPDETTGYKENQLKDKRRQKVMDDLERRLGYLPVRHRIILKELHAMTDSRYICFKELAVKHGITEQRVRQIYDESMEYLRESYGFRSTANMAA